MTRLVISPVARREMTAIWLYTADRWGVDRADAYVLQIEEAIARVVDLPSAGSLAAGLPPIYRKVKSGSHRIIYRQAEDELIVIRVLRSTS